MLAAGTSLGPYRILAPLGAGGMGEVYRALDTRLARHVAIKVVASRFAPSPEARARFEREARTISQLTHPHICTLYDVGREGDTDYLVMELLEGETLARRLHRGPLPAADVLRLGCEIASALDRAHGAGVVHRDLKPGNVMLTPAGAKLMDFGLAVRFAASPPSASLTESPTVSGPLTAEGATLGTPQYMSPEQLDGRPLDARSDIFAFGSVLFEMATGRPAFSGDGRASLIAAIMTGEPASLADAATGMPTGFERVLRRCLAKDADERWQDGGQVARELEGLRERSAGAARRPPEPGPGSRRRTSAGARFAMVVALLAAVAAVAYRVPLTRLLRGAPIEPFRRQWILVADFEGPAAEPELAGAAREMVCSLLDQSNVVVTLSRDQVRQALRVAGRPDTSRVGPEVARELAQRNAVRAIVEGRIDHLGAGYPVTLRVRDAERDTLIATVSGAAAAEADLVPALSRLASRLCATLSRRRGAIVATREPIVAPTPSFAAYRKFSEGVAAAASGDPEGAIAACREAIAIDPDFARAYFTKGVAFLNAFRYDSAEVAFEAAWSRNRRLSEPDRIRLEATMARFDGDEERALACCDRLIADDATASVGLHNRTIVLFDLGRFDEIPECERESITRSPVAPAQFMIMSMAMGLIRVGRFAEAGPWLSRLSGAYALQVPLYVAQAEGRWDRADSLARALLRTPDAGDGPRRAAQDIVTSEAAARGELSIAEGPLIAGVEEWRREYPLQPSDAVRSLALLSWTLGTRMPDVRVSVPPGTPAQTLLTHALVAATLGDTAGARRLLGRARARPRAELLRQGASPEVIQAMIASRAGRWDEVVRVLEPTARLPIERGFAPFGAGRAWPRWLIADAFERSGRPDSAACYFELLLPEHQPLFYNDDPASRRSLVSLAHYRLVRLYARMGRRAAAERHLRELEATLTHPDPSLRRWIPDARAAVAAMEPGGAATRR